MEQKPFKKRENVKSHKSSKTNKFYKMKKCLSVLVASLGLVVIMASCKKSESAPSSPSINGKWYLTLDSFWTANTAYGYSYSNHNGGNDSLSGDVAYFNSYKFGDLINGSTGYSQNGNIIILNGPVTQQWQTIISGKNSDSLKLSSITPLSVITPSGTVIKETRYYTR